MNKITLDLDALAVESFAVEPAEAKARGTVQAFVGTQQPAHTCFYTCGTEVHFVCCTG